MANPVVSAAVALGLIYDQLGVALNAYGVFDDNASGLPRWQQAALVNWLADADLEVQRACAESPGSSYRNYFVNPTPAQLDNGDPLPATSIGPPQAVWIENQALVARIGQPAPTTWMNYFNEDDDNVFGGAAFTDRLYSVIDNRVYFCGAQADVYYCQIARATVPALPALPTLASPEAFTNTLVKAVIGWAASKEGDYPQVAQGFLVQYDNDLMSIRQGATEVPPVQQVQKQVAA